MEWWRKYSQNSSIQCIKYLSKPKSSKTERFFWVLLMLLGLVVFCLLMMKTTRKFTSNKIVLELSREEIPIKHFPFPAITLCTQSFFEEVWPQFGRQFYVPSDNKYEMFTLSYMNAISILPSDAFLDFTDILLSQPENNLTIIEVLNSTGQVEWLLMTLWGEWKHAWSLPLQMTLTKWGFCFSFNMMALPDLLYLEKISLDFEPELIYLTPHYILQTELLDEPAPWNASSKNDFVNFRLGYWPDHENLDPVARQGYHIIIHGADELPSDFSFHFHQHSQHSNADIFPKQTLVSDKVKQMSIERRNCYLDSEMSLKLFKIYSKHNCEHECQSFAFAERCRCVPFYLLRTLNDKTCDLRDKKCTSAVERDLARTTAKCNCLERCDALSYEIRLYQQPMYYSSIFFGFGVDYFQPLVKVQAFSFSEFLSNIGSFMGLLAGMSVLSIIEIFFHAVKAFSSKPRKVVPWVHLAHASRVAWKNENHALYQFSKYFDEFIKKSDIHGIQYTKDRTLNRCGRIFWTMTVASSIAFCLVLISDMFRHAEKSPVATSINVKLWNLDDIPFPSLVICPDIDLEIYLADKRCFYQGECDNDTQELSFQTIEVGSSQCDFDTSFDINVNFKNDIRMKTKMSYAERAKRYSRVKWLQDQSFCYEQQATSMLAPILTMNGLCYIFNSDQDMFNRSIVSEDFWSTEKVQINCSGSHQTSSSKKRLTFEASDDRGDRYCLRSFISTCMQHSNDFPNPTKIKLNKLHHSHYVVRPIVHIADENLRELSPKQRNCYFQNERKLKYFNKYTKENCLRECQSNTTLEVCRCVTYDNIRDKTTKICNEYIDFHCYDHILGILGDEHSVAFKTCDCLPACNSIDYNLEFYYESIKDHGDGENSKKAALSIYFAEDEFIVLKRYASFGTVTLLSNIGGLLGLFIGISFLSIVEVFYFFVIRFINNLWWKGQ